MKQFSVTVKDPDGIHARPAGLLLKEVKKLSSQVMLKKGDRQVSALKLMAVMSLGVQCGDSFEVLVDGGDEAASVQQLQAFFEQNL